MTDLTEKWRKGELPVGYYYIKKNIGVVPMLFDGNKFYCEYVSKPNSIERVIAPVPSYDKWKNFVDANTNLFDAVKMLNKDNFSLEKQNIELKETNEALEAELKEVCDVLIRKCPEMKEWVMLNWKNLYEETEK